MKRGAMEMRRGYGDVEAEERSVVTIGLGSCKHLELCYLLKEEGKPCFWWTEDSWGLQAIGDHVVRCTPPTLSTHNNTPPTPSH